MARQVSIDAICRLVNALLPVGYPPIEDVAGLLQTSPRTLQRRPTGRRISGKLAAHILV